MDRDTTSSPPPTAATRPPRTARTVPAAAPGSPAPAAFDGLRDVDHRYLVRMASRMLGDVAAAEDVVQDALSRLVRVPPDEIDDVRGWLAVVVRRLCLNHIQSAYNRREMVAGTAPPEHHLAPVTHGNADPADRVTLDDQVRIALVLLLDRLRPAERTAFVLHDVFGFPFDDVAEIVGRSPPPAASSRAAPGGRCASTRPACGPTSTRTSGTASSPSGSSRPAPVGTSPSVADGVVHHIRSFLRHPR